MNWEDRIHFSILLLEEVSSMMGDPDATVNGRRYSEELASHAEALRQYVDDSGLSDMDPKRRKLESYCILKDAIETVFPKVFSLNEAAAEIVPDYLTFEEACEKLISDYQEDLKSGAGEIAGMSVREWLDENGIILVGDDEEDVDRKVPSSSDCGK